MANCRACGRKVFFFQLKKGLCSNCVANIDQQQKHTSAIQESHISSTLPQNASPDISATPAACAPADSEATQQKTQSTPPKEPKKYRVTGMEHYESNLMNLAVEDDNFRLAKKDLIDQGLVGERIWKYFFCSAKAELVPEPDNPHDPKAIKVVVDGQHVGYVKAGSCAHLLKVIREDRIKKISCDITGGPYKFIEEDYDYERDKEVYTLDKGTAPYSVHLTIDEE